MGAYIYQTKSNLQILIYVNCQLVEYYHVAGEGEELMPQNR